MSFIVSTVFVSLKPIEQNPAPVLQDTFSKELQWLKTLINRHRFANTSAMACAQREESLLQRIHYAIEQSDSIAMECLYREMLEIHCCYDDRVRR